MTSKDINTTELQQTKDYLAKIGKNELYLSDLEQSSNNQTNSPNNNDSKKGLYIGLAVVALLVIGIVAWLLMRNKNEK